MKTLVHYQRFFFFLHTLQIKLMNVPLDQMGSLSSIKCFSLKAQLHMHAPSLKVC